jgi:hypothetical protein
VLAVGLVALAIKGVIAVLSALGITQVVSTGLWAAWTAAVLLAKGTVIAYTFSQAAGAAVMTAATAVQMALGFAVNFVSGAIGVCTSAVGFWAAAMSAVSILGMISTIGSMAAALIPLVVAFTAVKLAVNLVLDAIKGFASAGKVAVDGFGALFSGIANLKDVGDIFGKWWKVLSDVATIAKDDMPAAFNIAKLAARGIWLDIQRVAPPLFALLIDGFKMVWEEMAISFRTEFDPIMRQVASLKHGPWGASGIIDTANYGSPTDEYKKKKDAFEKISNKEIYAANPVTAQGKRLIAAKARVDAKIAALDKDLAAIGSADKLTGREKVLKENEQRKAIEKHGDVFDPGEDPDRAADKAAMIAELKTQIEHLEVAQKVMAGAPVQPPSKKTTDLQSKLAAEIKDREADPFKGWSPADHRIRVLKKQLADSEAKDAESTPAGLAKRLAEAKQQLKDAEAGGKVVNPASVDLVQRLLDRFGKFAANPTSPESLENDKEIAKAVADAIAKAAAKKAGYTVDGTDARAQVDAYKEAMATPPSPDFDKNAAAQKTDFSGFADLWKKTQQAMGENEMLALTKRGAVAGEGVWKIAKDILGKIPPPGGHRRDWGPG